MVPGRAIAFLRGMTVFKERVRELPSAYLPPDPASRTSYEAGDIAQCDLWFPPITLAVGFGQRRTPMQLPVLTMVCGYSRWLSAILILTRRAEDLFAGWWHLIHALGVVRRTLVWDGEGAIGRCRSGKVELTCDCHAFRGVLGANPGHSAPNAAARHRYPPRRPSTRQLCPAALV
jgi:hypothetical protein